MKSVLILFLALASLYSNGVLAMGNHASDNVDNHHHPLSDGQHSINADGESECCQGACHGFAGQSSIAIISFIPSTPISLDRPNYWCSYITHPLLRPPRV